MRYLILSAICLLSITTKAQEINFQTDTIRFHATQFLDLAANVSVQKGCDFIWNASNNIQWIQRNGDVVYTLSIATISPISLAANGSVTADVAMDSQIMGMCVFAREGDSMRITLTLNGGTNQINNQYSISSFEKL